MALKATEQPIDTWTAAGKAFLDMLGVFAEFETNLRRERQIEGIAKAKARGVYKGKSPALTALKFFASRARAWVPVPSPRNWELAGHLFILVGRLEVEIARIQGGQK